MNMKDLNKIAKETKVVKRNVEPETTEVTLNPRYNFTNCETVYDIEDGYYNAYVETLSLSNKMATIRLYLKNSHTNKGVMLNYAIGLATDAYTKQHTTDLQLQLGTDKEFLKKHSEFWKGYMFNLNDLLAQGFSEDEAKAVILNNTPKWYKEGYYKDLGNIVVKASHYVNKAKEVKLQLGFNEYIINKATK